MDLVDADTLSFYQLLFHIFHILSVLHIFFSYSFRKQPYGFHSDQVSLCSPYYICCTGATFLSKYKKKPYALFIKFLFHVKYFWEITTSLFRHFNYIIKKADKTDKTDKLLFFKYFFLLSTSHILFECCLPMRFFPSVLQYLPNSYPLCIS